MLRAQMTTTSTARIPFKDQVHRTTVAASAMNLVLYVDKARYTTVQWKNNHSRAIPLAAKYALIFCSCN